MNKPVEYIFSKKNHTMLEVDKSIASLFYCVLFNFLKVSYYFTWTLLARILTSCGNLGNDLCGDLDIHHLPC